jgi:hypothetical protein
VKRRKGVPVKRVGFFVILGFVALFGASANAEAACLSKVVGKKDNMDIRIQVVAPASDVGIYVAAGYVENQCPTEKGYVQKIVTHWCNPPDAARIPDRVWLTAYGVPRSRMCSSAQSVLAAESR